MFGELISVKEYAERKSMTEQAVYKQLTAGKLQSVELSEKGKTKKYVFAPCDMHSEPEPRERPSERGSADAALAELAIKALTSQLEEKDRQIEKLTQLLDNSQQLQAHGQKLLEQADAAPAEDEAAAPPATKRSSFIKRLFS